jgi:benzoate transport
MASEMPQESNPARLIEESPMSLRQVLLVALCILINGLDGFDVLSISFAAPGISAEWGLEGGRLGIVLSMELIGMALGSVALGNLADRIGRRPVVLWCLLFMSAGMLLSATAVNIWMLLACRMVTGFGVGGMLSTIAIIAAEYSNARRRNLVIGLVGTGSPLGAVLGGAVASYLLADFGWRSVFVFGGLATAMLIPIAFFLLPESIEHLCRARSRDALPKVNRILTSFGHQVVESLPDAPTTAPKPGLGELIGSQYLRTTVLLSLAYLAHIVTFYFILKWGAKIIVDLGFAASIAGTVLVWANVGGVTGGIAFSLLTQRVKLRALLMIFMALAAVMVSLFGLTGADILMLSLVAGIAGFCGNGALVGIYALAAQCYPASLRGSGMGLVMAIGRVGAISGPIIAGTLLDWGWDRSGVAIAIASGSVIAAIMVGLLRERKETGPDDRSGHAQTG